MCGKFVRAFRRTLGVETRSEGLSGVGASLETAVGTCARPFAHLLLARVEKKEALGLGSRVVSSDALTPDNPTDRVSTPKVRRKARTNFPHIFQKLQTCRSRSILARFGLTDSVCSSFAQTLRPKKTARQTDIHSGMSAKEGGPTMCFACESENRKIFSDQACELQPRTDHQTGPITFMNMKFT